MKIRYGENPQSRCASIEPFAYGRAAGWVARKEWPIPLPAHQAEKSAPDFVYACIHRLSLGRGVLRSSANPSSTKSTCMRITRFCMWAARRCKIYMMHFRYSILVRSLGIKTIVDRVPNSYQDSETLLCLGGDHEIAVEMRNASEEQISELTGHELYLVCQATGKWEPKSQEVRNGFEALREGRAPYRTESLDERERELKEAFEEGRISGYSFPWDVLPPLLQDFIGQVTAELHQAVKKAADALRWRGGILGPPSPYSSPKAEWSFDGEQWHALPQRLVAHIRVESAGTLFVTDEVKADAEALLSKDLTEPLGQVLFREAWALQQSSPSSALIIGVASLEVGFKKYVAELVPEAAWLVEEAPTPPLVPMLKNYLPKLPAKCTFEGKVLPPPKKLRNKIDQAVRERNKVIHKTGSAALDDELLKEWLLAIRDVQWLLDYYRGFQWALIHVREETKKEMRL
jgi:hypothetical protein